MATSRMLRTCLSKLPLKIALESSPSLRQTEDQDWKVVFSNKATVIPFPGSQCCLCKHIFRATFLLSRKIFRTIAKQAELITLCEI